MNRKFDRSGRGPFGLSSPLSRVSARLAAGAIVIAALMPRAAAQVRIESNQHPAHYVLLIDASGSNVATKAKTDAYRKALGAAVERLFSTGFGPVVPPIDRQQDFVSVYTFGIVPNDASGFAYQHLRGRNLFDLVQQRLSWMRHASSEDVARAVKPERFHALTLMVWAPHLALHAAQAPDNATHAQRTYQIVVSDGLGNQGSLEAEEELIRRWATGDSVERAAQAVAAIQRQYRVRDGADRWRKTFGPPLTPLYLEAAEVEVRDIVDLTVAGAAVNPFGKIDFSWDREHDGNSSGTVTAIASSRMRALLTKLHSKSWRMRIDGAMTGSGEHPTLNGPLIASAMRRGRSPCQAETLRYELEGVAAYRDALFGLRTLRLSAYGSLPTPLPARCTVAFLAGRAGAGAGVLAAITTLVWFVYYSRFSTHIAVFEPASTIGTRLRWDQVVRKNARLIPHEAGRPALILSFKTNSLVRMLFYRQARATLITEPPGILQWPNGDETVRVSDYEQLIARWTGASKAFHQISVILERGPRRAEYVLDNVSPRENEHGPA